MAENRWELLQKMLLVENNGNMQRQYDEVTHFRMTNSLYSGTKIRALNYTG